MTYDAGRYRATVDGMSRRTRRLIARYFHHDRAPARLWDFLAIHGLCQADVVLALLRMDLLTEAERLVGRRITHCPSGLRTGKTPVLRAEVRPDPVILSVVENPRAPGSRARECFEAFRVGFTIAQARLRGARRRDVRAALKHGWITMGARS